MIKTLTLLMALFVAVPVFADRTAVRPLSPKSAAKLHASKGAPLEMVQGCSICCCEVWVPKGSTVQQAVRECFRTGPEVCKEACRERLKELKKNPKTTRQN